MTHTILPISEPMIECNELILDYGQTTTDMLINSTLQEICSTNEVLGEKIEKEIWDLRYTDLDDIANSVESYIHRTIWYQTDKTLETLHKGLQHLSEYPTKDTNKKISKGGKTSRENMHKWVTEQKDNTEREIRFQYSNLVDVGTHLLNANGEPFNALNPMTENLDEIIEYTLDVMHSYVDVIMTAIIKQLKTQYVLG